MAGHIQKIYLHVGLHKTATSSFQETCAKNSRLLLTHGICYPTSIDANHSTSIVPLSIVNPAEYYLERLPDHSPGTESPRITAMRKALLKEITTSTVEKLVISGEDIGIMPRESVYNLRNFLQKALPEARITVIVALRNPAHYTASLYQEAIKASFQEHKYYAEMHVPYKDILDNLSACFDRDNLIVFPFEEAVQHPKGPVGYLMNIISGNNETLLDRMDIVRSNDSISDTAVRLIDFANKLTNTPRFAWLTDQRFQYGRQRNDTLPLWSLSGNKFLLSEEQTFTLFKKNAEILQFIEQEFGIRYTFEDTTFAPQDITIPSTFFDEITSAFASLSRILKVCVFQYIVATCSQVQTKQEKRILLKTKNWIQQHSKCSTIDLNMLTPQYEANELACKNLASQFGLEHKDYFQIYYQIAVFLYGHHEYEAARSMIQYAKNLAPHEEHIIALAQEYDNIAGNLALSHVHKKINILNYYRIKSMLKKLSPRLYAAAKSIAQRGARWTKKK